MSFDVTKMELTPVKVYFTPASSTAEIFLGGTLGNLKISVATEKAVIKADQTGTTPLDKRISGHMFTVTTEIAQVNDFSVVQHIFPSASAISSSGIEWFNAVGHADQTVAGQLRLHPQSMADSASAFDWTFFKVCPTENSEITYSPTEQSKFKVEWAVYPDISNPITANGTDYRFMKFGT